MFCPKCGSLNPDDAKFCGNCSSQLAVEPVTDTVRKVEEIVDINQDQEAISTPLKYSVAIAALLFPIIGVVMGIMYLAQGETESKKEVGKFWLIASAVGVILYLMMTGSI